MKIAKLFFDAYWEYLQNRDIPRYPRLPYMPSPKDEVYVNPSSFGMCPLQSWHKKNNTPKKFPKPLSAEVSRYHKMTQGELDSIAPIDAMLHKFGDESIAMQASDTIWGYTRDNQGFGAEVTVAGTIGGVMIRGRMDGYLSYDFGDGWNEGVVFEVKRTDLPKNGWSAEDGAIPPKDRYLLQTAAYMHLTEARYGALVIISRDYINVWELEIGTPPRGYRLYNDTIKEVEWSGAIQQAWVTTEESVYQEAYRQSLYASALRIDELPTEPPILDPANHETGWLCMTTKGESPDTRKTDPNDPLAIMRDNDSPDNGKTSKARWLRPASYVANCEWCCHAEQGAEYLLYKDGSEKWVVKK